MRRRFRLLPRPRDYGATGRLGPATCSATHHLSPLTSHISLLRPPPSLGRLRRHIRRRRGISLIEFLQDKAGCAAGPDLITPMMNHEIEIILKRSDHHFADSRAEALTVQMRTSYCPFANHHPFRIDQVNKISDAEPKVLTHLMK